MKYILSTLLTLSTVFLFAQEVLFQDKFDQGILSIDGTPDGYTAELVDEVFQIRGNGLAAAWAAIAYNFHDGSGNAMEVDASSSPKLYIRARGENLPNLRIDFRDRTGYVTNQNSVSVNLSDEYVIYELNYTNRLWDGAYGGPCTEGPCPVDPATLTALEIFVNAANGEYIGTIDIDWLSIGAPYEELPEEPAYDIRYNQVTYFKGREKLINIVSDEDFDDATYTIKNDGGTTVMSGTVSSSDYWDPSESYVHTVDVSSLNAVGTYTFTTPERVIEFNISEDGYEDLAVASLKYYYFNRASQEITEELGAEFQRGSGHPDDVVIVHSSAASTGRPTGTIISAAKGWYDAGDYNKYIVNSGISTYTLLAAYEHFSDYYDALELELPERGGDMPDILDEIIWNLDWTLDMQDPEDGGVYHKLTGLNFSGEVMPEDYDLDRYVVQKTTAATLDFAGVCAVAARIFENFEDIKPGYSAELLQAAEDAYDWAEANPTVYFSQPSDVNTGAYGDNNVTDEFEWAAVELFISTGDQEYLEGIDVSQIDNGIPGWNSMSPLALISMSYHRSAFDGVLDMDAVHAKLIETADALKNEVANSTLRVAMGGGDFFWGSNGQAGNQIMMLIRAYEIDKDASYLNAAFTAMDYLVGRNGTGYCYVSGFGDKPMIRPHHRISQADAVGAPVPGMIAGGPNPGQQDNCSGYPNDYPASSYTDEWCSYASNEVTINWNAPLAYAVNALQYYQDEKEGVVVGVKGVVEDKGWGVYPNPTRDVLRFHSPENSGLNDIDGADYTVVDSQGRVVMRGKVNVGNGIDVSILMPGIYFVGVVTDEGIGVERFLRI